MSRDHHKHSWRKLSQQQRTAKPLCADPFGWHEITGHYAPATETHHIENVQDAPEKLLHSDNLLTLCPDCHKAIHKSKDIVMRMLADGVPADKLARVIQSGGR